MGAARRRRGPRQRVGRREGGREHGGNAKLKEKRVGDQLRGAISRRKVFDFGRGAWARKGGVWGSRERVGEKGLIEGGSLRDPLGSNPTDNRIEEKLTHKLREGEALVSDNFSLLRIPSALREKEI